MYFILHPRIWFFCLPRWSTTCLIQGLSPTNSFRHIYVYPKEQTRISNAHSAALENCPGMPLHCFKNSRFLNKQYIFLHARTIHYGATSSKDLWCLRRTCLPYLEVDLQHSEKSCLTRKRSSISTACRCLLDNNPCCLCYKPLSVITALSERSSLRFLAANKCL